MSVLYLTNFPILQQRYVLACEDFLQRVQHHCQVDLPWEWSWERHSRWRQCYSKKSHLEFHAFKPIRLKNALQEAVPSIDLYTYEEKDINFQNAIPKLKPMKGTMRLHKIEYILQQQEVTLMIKEKSTDATALKVSLEREMETVERDENWLLGLFRRELPGINGKPDDSILFIAGGWNSMGVGKNLKSNTQGGQVEISSFEYLLFSVNNDNLLYRST